MGVVDSEMMVAACAGDWVDGVVVVVDYVAVDELAVVWVVAGACPETIAPAPAADIRTRKAASAVVVEEMDFEAAVLPENDFAVEAAAAVEKAFLFCLSEAPDGKINGGAVVLLVNNNRSNKNAER